MQASKERCDEPSIKEENEKLNKMAISGWASMDKLGSTNSACKKKVEGALSKRGESGKKVSSRTHRELRANWPHRRP